MQPRTSQWVVCPWRAGEGKSGHCQHFRDSQTYTSSIYKEPRGYLLASNSQKRSTYYSNDIITTGFSIIGEMCETLTGPLTENLAIVKFCLVMHWNEKF